MRAARFFIDAPLSSGADVELSESTFHHAVRVLRLRDGEPIVLFNGQGGEFAARLAINGSRASAAIQAFDAVEREAPLSITLVQSWIATDKLDWVVEKSVELGVHSIVLAPAQRSVVQLADDRLIKRIARLRELIVAACAQSGRNRIPPLAAPSSFGAALTLALDNAASGVMLEPDADAPLPTIVMPDSSLALAVGPEGGFDQSEIDLAHRQGWRSCHLGPRILRTETAGMAALATVQAVAGDFMDRRA
ncbi:MAG TPA: 16S rRNA (uracil(1498)-N(3))-methyltransferase [Burkholderiaceae bacterium]|nr:16S rRNA (uracil(1498)-N(3))-methyltransferase [Burkholderiaceae bacterium]